MPLEIKMRLGKRLLGTYPFCLAFVQEYNQVYANLPKAHNECYERVLKLCLKPRFIGLAATQLTIIYPWGMKRM